MIAYSGYRGAYTGVPTGTVGAIAELEVATDLMKKGYEVFRSLSQSCSCDLAILKNKKLFRVEVKSAYRNSNNSVSYPEQSHNKGHKYDILALYLHRENKIIYRPEIA